MRGNKTLKPKKKNIRKMRISSKRNKQNTKKYKKIRNRKKRVSRKVGGMTGENVNNLPGSGSVGEFCDKRIKIDFDKHTKDFYVNLKKNSHWNEANNNNDFTNNNIDFNRAESDPTTGRGRKMRKILGKKTGIYLKFTESMDELSENQDEIIDNLFLYQIYNTNYTIKQQIEISKQIISSFSADVTRSYNKQYLKDIIKGQIDGKSKTLLYSHLDIVLRRMKAGQISGIAEDVAEACFEIAERAADPENTWNDIEEQLKDKKDTILKLKGYILSKYKDAGRQFQASINQWSLEKIYAWVLCGIGVQYLPTDPLRGYFIISLSNIGHHILDETNKPPDPPTVSLPSFITLCIDLFRAEAKGFALNMYKLLDELFHTNNEIRGFVNMSAFAAKYTLKILQFICNSKGKSIHQSYRSQWDDTVAIDEIHNLANRDKSRSLDPSFRAPEDRGAEDRGAGDRGAEDRGAEHV